MLILSISAYYHDSAACLIEHDRIICALEEERFSRIKHDNNFPIQAINFCLKQRNVNINDIDLIAYYERPLLKFERILQTFVETYPYALKTFTKAILEWIGYKIKVEQTIRKKLKYKGKIYFIPHHLSHAAASYYSSPFSDSAILSVDGVGEYQTTGLWHGKSNQILSLNYINFPDSLGLLYSTFTAFLGFKVNEDEYKVMGLAAYGEAKYIDKIYKVIDIKDDGSFRMNTNYFAYRESFQMWNKSFEKIFGEPRKSSEKITERDKNLAASIQSVTEEIYFKILNNLYKLTKSKNLCLSGGVALNALANGKIYDKTPFKNIYILGASGDNGAAAGAGLYVYYSLLNDNQNNKRKPITNLCLGSSYSNENIENSLNKSNLKYIKFKTEKELIDKTAELLSQNQIIGWFQGRMEFGPRALGARSILANPKSKYMKEEVNKIKIREQFRPFAGSILQNKVHEFFEVPEKNHWSPFMVFCFKVRKDKRDDLVAIVHKDNTCRIQTVSEENGKYHRLIKKFYEITGVPCVLNTSFNLKGEPIVENPDQAISDFQKTEMDYLIIGDFLVSKT